jgi:predicted dithiol-disulfide oxidoreductase (DUF899 family)
MALPEVVSREEWLQARLDLLAQEKEETRRIAALNATRRRLPMVAVEKKYVFEGPRGPVSLRELFGQASQLFVQHVMFGPDWEAACPGCTASINALAPAVLTQVRSRDTEFVLISRAPLAKLQAYAKAQGWDVPWYSSEGSDFNYDFEVTMDKARGQLRYNFADAAQILEEDEESTELPGFSTFVRDGDDIFHTYSAYARGTELTIPAYAYLDMTAFGRSEKWEEPKGRARTVHGADPTFTS